MEAADQSPEADPFVRRYGIGLCAIAIVVLFSWLLNMDTRVSELNDLLAADAELSAYPYSFRVLSLEQGVASMSRPDHGVCVQ